MMGTPEHPVCLRCGKYPMKPPTMPPTWHVNLCVHCFAALRFAINRPWKTQAENDMEKPNPKYPPAIKRAVRAYVKAHMESLAKQQVAYELKAKLARLIAERNLKGPKRGVPIEIEVGRMVLTVALAPRKEVSRG